MQETLSHYFGYDTFRPGQEEIISKIIDHRNVLGVLPTGGGKSICYQDKVSCMIKFPLLFF
jgi:ATP-dependent DNA helicase RecQ